MFKGKFYKNLTASVESISTRISFADLQKSNMEPQLFGIIQIVTFQIANFYHKCRSLFDKTILQTLIHLSDIFILLFNIE